MPLIVVLLACPAPEPVDSGDSAPVVDPEAPVVETARVTCAEHTTGETFTQWAGSATVTDPQGLSTIEAFGTLAVGDARGDLGSVDLLCADGACTASWRDHDIDIECDDIAVTTYDFAFTVVDTDGHVSAPLVVAGERVDE